MSDKPLPSFDATEEHAIRVEKVKKLSDLGIQAWPEFTPVSHTCSQLKKVENVVQGEETTTSYSIAGRIMSRREHGKTMFMVIRDRSDSIQVYVKKDVLGEDSFTHISHLIDLGDILWVEGPLFITKTGELTLAVKSWKLLSKCLHPLPEKFHGLTDVEQRYRQRYLDMISNHDTQKKFIARSKALSAIRSFLQDKDFLEVETPMLHPIAGGAAARPFSTHHNAYDMELFLRIAPELYLKRLVIGGFERVFEINRNFRNEGVSTRHNPEFTMLEFYMAHGDYRDGMKIAEELIAHAVKTAHETTVVEFGNHVINFTAPFARMTVEQAIEQIGGIDAKMLLPGKIDAVIAEHKVHVANKNASHGEKLFALFEELVESKIVQPTFIIGYPIEISPLAKRDPKNPELATRFELFVAGMELANGFTELNDPFDQADRFKQQLGAKAGGDHEAHNYDADYIHALEYGLAPTVGVGIGMDRLMMMVTNTTSIKDIILFPTMKNREHAG